MAGKWTNAGENLIAEILGGSTTPPTKLYLGLYTSPSAEPGEDVEPDDLTEPSGNGYTRKELDRGSWSIIDDIMTYTQQTFTANGGAWGNVYGYFIATTDAGDSDEQIIAVEQFTDAPYNVQDQESVKVTPKLTIS